VDAIRPLVLTYLGGLPGAGRDETWRPVGGQPPAGIVQVSTAEGKEPKSLVRLVFSSEGRYTLENVHYLATLVRLLQLRLREVLREDMGAVYGVNVSGSLVFRPTERSSVTFSFSCAPDKAESLTRAVFQEIAAVKEHGADPEHLAKVLASQHRERESDLKSNSFWSGVLASYYRSDWDLRNILRFDTLVEQTTSARLQAVAREVLPDNRYVLGVLSPAPGAPPAPTAPGAPSAPFESRQPPPS
jgi:zinc protease